MIEFCFTDLPCRLESCNFKTSVCCLDYRYLDFSKQSDVSTAISYMFHIFIAYEHYMNYLKELCLVGFFTVKTQVQLTSLPKLRKRNTCA